MRKDELEEHVIQQRIDSEVRKELTRWVHIVCRTATSTAMVVVYWIGTFVKENWKEFGAGIDAFIKAATQ